MQLFFINYEQLEFLDFGGHRFTVGFPFRMCYEDLLAPTYSYFTSYEHTLHFTHRMSNLTQTLNLHTAFTTETSVFAPQ